MRHLAFYSPSDPNLELTLKVIAAILAILAASATCGKLALMVRQPRVLGEMVAGVLLGPTFLGLLFPGVQKSLFPSDVKPILYVLSTIGLTLYMFLVGAGLDHGKNGAAGAGVEGGRSQGRQATLLAVSGIVPSLVLGTAAGLLWYSRFSRNDVSRMEFAFFIGGALSLTAFPMLARILYERGLENSPLGRLTLVAASMDDVAAWCFLAVLSAVHAGSGPMSALQSILLAGVFAAVMLFGVARLLRPIGARVAQTKSLTLSQMYIVAFVVLGAGWFTDRIGIYSVFGGFIAGLAMPRDAAFREALHGRMMDFVSVFLLPIFFAFSGLNTKLGGIAGATMLLAFATLLIAGFVGKYVGCGLAMRATGFSWGESWAVGGLMNARGLMILIFINIGLSQQIISQDVFSILVLVAVVTTAGAVPLYRLALPPKAEGRLMPRASDTSASDHDDPTGPREMATDGAS
ncbi:Kef-type K+ transport system membrane component KefB [Streptomyces griseochromogenes]|uniref:Kef-type K+ transport system membrane component KefB n=2 Tax=Streptomyces griseochromogenes TaxID=68214 RepID=A0ABS4M2S2_9ACTN|nr:cation:proton antiporter [Streptomyces griseochromogenes]MBP2053981.1 Kef-type K+ transport system membrane component KefB [Streptomyces griseochromogenes]